MKVQKHIRKVKGKEYPQYLITIPSKIVLALGLEGKDLQWGINKAGRLELIEKK